MPDPDPVPPGLDGTPSGPSTKESAWRRALPVVIGLALVAFVLSRLDLQKFTESLKRTNYAEFFAAAFAVTVVVLVADVYATRDAYRRTVGLVHYGDLFVLRAASYLPSMLNHHVGQAWLTYFLAKARNAPLVKTAGATLFVYATTFGGLYLFLLVGLPFNHGRTVWLLPTVAAVGIAGLLYAAVIVVRPAFLADRPLLRPLFDVGLRGHLGALATRLPHVFTQFIATWAPFALFGIHIPLGDAFALLPVISFIVTLPVSPQGLGTRETLSIALISGFADGTPAERSAVIAASTLSWLAALTLIQLVLSPMFMKRAYRLLGRAAITAQIPEPSA